MEYDVYGKIYRRKYSNEKCSYNYFEKIYASVSGIYYLNLEEYNSPKELFEEFVEGETVDDHKYDALDEKRKKIMELEDKLIFVTLDKENYKLEVFDGYKIIKTIEVDREFRDGDTLTYNDSDYKVTYKYNSETNKQELYIDYTCEIIVDCKLDNKIDNLIKETNKLIENYNEDINKQIKELEKEPKDKSTPPPLKIVGTIETNESWFTRIINKIRGAR